MTAPGQRWTFSLRSLLVAVTAGCVLLAAGVAFPVFGFWLLIVVGYCLFMPLLLAAMAWPLIVVCAGFAALNRLDRWRDAKRLAASPKR